MLTPQLLAVLPLTLDNTLGQHMTISNFDSKATANANAQAVGTHIPDYVNAAHDKADKKANALKTPAHRSASDARFEEDARDLHRILPASRKVYIEGSRP